MIETAEKPKKAFLVGLWDDTRTKNEGTSLFRELVALADTLGLDIVGQELVHVRGRPQKYGLGTGKAQELYEKATSLDAECILFDRSISPTQQRNWEELCGISAMDRHELIIQIFSSRATTREAQLQVALAELYYSLPRLTHKYIDLSQQRGGRYGTRGSGETKLETDRRQVERQIQQIKAELKEVHKQREVQRSQRKRSQIPTCAVAGYTNAGKSTLLNALTDHWGDKNAEVFVEDKLFATLDPTSRRIRTRAGNPLIIIDTVGFIRQLPHDLITAFRSTLEEVQLADLVVHVLDASDPDIRQYYETSASVLRELGADKNPTIIALNKIDKGDVPDLAALQEWLPGSIPISAQTGAGLEELVEAIEEKLVSGKQ